MRIRLGVPMGASHDEKEGILNAALESVTRGAESEIASGQAPLATNAIKANRIRWRPEPPGDEHFDLPSTAMRRGWGDCDDLAPWHAAGLRLTGEDPEAISIVRPSGPGRWHAIVQRSDGRIDDPSLWAGMHSVDGDLPYRGPFWPSMFGGRLALATYPQGSHWDARVDVPSSSVPAVYSLLSRGRSPGRAVAGACAGVPLVCGYDAYDDDIARIAGIHDMLIGVPPEEVEAALDQQGYVGFLPALAPAALSLAAPLASKALGLKGGGGAAPGGGGGGLSPGSTLHCPGGPIIVRF